MLAPTQPSERHERIDPEKGQALCTPMWSKYMELPIQFMAFYKNIPTLSKDKYSLWQYIRLCATHP